MRILSIFNHYLLAGGEAAVFEAECQLLLSKGHDLIRYERRNDDVVQIGAVRTGIQAVWSRRTYREISDILRSSRVDVMHCHNTFPLVSPAAYYAAARYRVPVVQTLHNYRLLCPGALLNRDTHPCEQCVGHAVPWRGALHRCYQSSVTASSAVAAMLAVHTFLDTWKSRVSLYLALTDFARDKFIRGGLPADKVSVKPNFLSPDPGAGEGNGRYALFVGYLAAHKGVEILIECWQSADMPYDLVIAGDGPLKEFVSEAAGRHPRIRYVGRKSAAQVLELMQDATVLLFPSTWYEGMPRTIIEAYAAGLPVIASRIGAMVSMVDHGRTGLLVDPGSAPALGEAVRTVFSSEGARRAMRFNARNAFETRYTSERNYDLLMSAYRKAAECGGE